MGSVHDQLVGREKLLAAIAEYEYHYGKLNLVDYLCENPGICTFKQLVLDLHADIYSQLGEIERERRESLHDEDRCEGAGD